MYLRKGANFFIRNILEKKIIIAIDGHSSTGKSTLAKQLAKILGYTYVDTGAMYRAIAFYAMKKGYITDDFFQKEALINDLSQIQLNFKYNANLAFAEIYLNGVTVEKEIRTLEVSNYVSQVAQIPEVRAKLVEQQQQMGKNKALVMDGRDIATVVFPEAELKIFMTAKAETRAQRRFSELQKNGETTNFAAVLQNVVQRDYLDTHREDSPLLKAADAIELDNSNLNKEEQLAFLLQLVKEKLA